MCKNTKFCLNLIFSKFKYFSYGTVVGFNSFFYLVIRKSRFVNKKIALRSSVNEFWARPGVTWKADFEILRVIENYSKRLGYMNNWYAFNLNFEILWNFIDKLQCILFSGGKIILDNKIFLHMWIKKLIIGVFLESIKRKWFF